MKQNALLLSMKKTTFNGKDGNPITCGKVQLAISTENGFEPVDYYVSQKVYDDLYDSCPIGMEYEFNFNVDFLRKKIKLVGVGMN